MFEARINENEDELRVLAWLHVSVAAYGEAAMADCLKRESFGHSGSGQLEDNVAANVRASSRPLLGRR